MLVTDDRILRHCDDWQPSAHVERVLEPRTMILSLLYMFFLQLRNVLDLDRCYASIVVCNREIEASSLPFRGIHGKLRNNSRIWKSILQPFANDVFELLSSFAVGRELFSWQRGSRDRWQTWRAPLFATATRRKQSIKCRSQE